MGTTPPVVAATKPVGIDLSPVVLDTTLTVLVATGVKINTLVDQVSASGNSVMSANNALKLLDTWPAGGLGDVPGSAISLGNDLKAALTGAGLTVTNNIRLPTPTGGFVDSYDPVRDSGGVDALKTLLNQSITKFGQTSQSQQSFLQILTDNLKTMTEAGTNLLKSLSTIKSQIANAI
jgi:hypothetical protein